VEVDEVAAAAALHHAPRGDRRVDAAAHQHGHAAAGADRQSPGPLHLLEPRQDLVALDAQEHLDVGVLEPHREARRRLYDRTHLTVHLDGCQREALVRPLGRNAEAPDLPFGQRRDDRGAHLVELTRKTLDAHDVGHAANPGRARNDRIQIRFRLHEDPPGEGADAARPERLDRGAHVVAQDPLEAAAVAPLQGEFVVVDGEQVHGQPILRIVARTLPDPRIDAARRKAFVLY